ncbi:30S ribosomal protein S1 [Quillaja saponaria]|uniref:30S ribosomal protein S1 n=1 Tax=Quillaja saponaria TaxID=32244 RepID=A0AAD7L6W0_QUISA|nr:30S ribosomal protein S1 [Quillaja saponaria]
MDCLAFTTTTSASVITSKTHLCSSSPAHVCSSSLARRRTNRSLSFARKPNVFKVFASKDEGPKLDSQDQMELKFGRLLGEDPKLTLAKIMARKVNPDASYIEVEKSFYKNKGKLVEVEEVPFGVSKEVKSASSLDGLNLVRPVPKKGVKFSSDDKQVASMIKKPSQSARKAANVTKGSVPNVILRKPSMFNGDEDEEKSSRLRIKPNLVLKMQDEQVKAKFSNMTLLRKPESLNVEDTNEKQEISHNANALTGDVLELKTMKEPIVEESNFTLLQKPETIGDMLKLENMHEQFEDADVEVSNNIEERGPRELSEPATNAIATANNLSQSEQVLAESKQKDDIIVGNEAEFHQEPSDSSQMSDVNSVDSTVKFPLEASLQVKPARLDESVEDTSKSTTKEAVLMEPEGYRNAFSENTIIAVSPLEKSEDAGWNMAEDLGRTGDRGDVELISSSTRGFVVSFGSLIGFLPYRNLAARWKFLAFESWLRRKGLDPSIYKKNLSIIASYDAENKNPPLSSPLNVEIDSKVEEVVSPDMKLEDLLRIYEQDKLKFLSSFIGQKIKVNVVLVERKSRKLIFSMRPKEKEELVEKKRSLMAKLQVGDVVKCCVKKITYFGIFVEVEGVPALIHQTEVSWDATLDPASYFKVGQVVEAKVHQLNFALERIFLSLKEIAHPGPLIGGLESVVGDHNPLDSRLEIAQADTEWAEVESLIRELQQIDGIKYVSKGRFFLSPGLAPTFQVYMASMFENQYKLLARSGNKVQEVWTSKVVVQSSLDKEGMKSAILTCTKKVD